MMVWSINLFVLATGFFIVGMVKPQLILFWMDKPSRFPVFMLSTILFMVGATMFGQANIDKQKEITEQTSPKTGDTVPTVIVEQVKKGKDAIAQN